MGAHSVGMVNEDHTDGGGIDQPEQLFGDDEVLERHTFERTHEPDGDLDNAETALYNAIEAIQNARYGDVVELEDALSEIEGAFWELSEHYVENE